MHSPSAFLPLRGRANLAIAMLVVIALVSALSILYERDVQAIVDAATAGQPVNFAAAQAADDRTSMVSGLWLLVFIPTAIAFIAWFYRAYVNIERMGARDLRTTAGWSIGAWFVPFLNWVRPKQIMNDIWRASDPALPAGELRGWQNAAVAGLLHWWWAAFLGATIISNISGRMILNADTLDERVSAGEVGMYADAGLIVAAVLAVFVVLLFLRDQERRAAGLGGGGTIAVTALHPHYGALAHPAPGHGPAGSIPPPPTRM